MYPPQLPEDCTGEHDEEGNPTDIVGAGACGVNGNEKIFLADQSATDCVGGLAGPFQFGAFTVHTETQLIGDDSVLY